jgi:ABC-type taurine transport system substrate-binding protein
MSRLLAVIEDGALTAETDGSVLAVGGAVPTSAAGWLEVWFATTALAASKPVALVRAMRAAIERFQARAQSGLCCWVKSAQSARLVQMSGFYAAQPLIVTPDLFTLFVRMAHVTRD